MQCVVLAGGLGTRMQRFTASMPKALIPVAGEPFLRHQLRLLEANGVDNVVVLTGYRADMISAEIAHEAWSRLHVSCVADGEELLGTAGALRRVADLGVLDDVFILTYGDSYLTIDHRAVFEAFDPSRYGALMTVTASGGDREHRNAAYAAGRVRLYRKGVANPADLEMHHVDYGLSVMSTSAIVDAIDPGERADLAGVFESLSVAGRLQGLETELCFHEIGSEDGLADLERYLMAAVARC